MGTVVQFKVAAGNTAEEHPAIRVLRERMGQLDSAEEFALQSLRESLDDDQRGRAISAEIFKVAGDQSLDAECLRGWLAGMFIGRLFAR